MTPVIIDIDLPLMRQVTFNWRIDWRGRPPSQGLNGIEQVVYNAAPRIVGEPVVYLEGSALLYFRALIARGRGRVNVYRVPLLDPLGHQPKPRGGSVWSHEFAAWRAGHYVEVRPQVACAAGAAAGAASIVVNETGLAVPVQVGQWMSYDDWPFMVATRSGAGAAVTLGVERLAVAIPPGGLVDVHARGLFRATDDAMGWPSYGAGGFAEQPLSFVEWMLRL